MSYILDALKKSEQERGHGSAPSVQTLHSSGLSYDTSKTHLWPYILLAAIVINLAALLYFIVAKNDIGTSTQDQQGIAATKPAVTGTAQTLTNKRVVTTTRGKGSEDAIVYKPVSMPGTNQVVVKEIPRAKEIKTAQFQQTRGAVLEMDELPFEMLQHIPVMEFSAHVYSSNPVQRSIVINGRLMEEGDRFASDLLLSEITPDGAIFDFQGQLFHQGVIAAWN